MNNSKIRKVVVFLFILIFVLISFINLRGEYLQYSELGENYIEVFFTNLQYKYIIFGVNFVILYLLIYLKNREIKKGLKAFFDKEKKEMPKLLNKSIAFVVSAIVSIIMSKILIEKILLFSSNASFGITEPIFNLDISFYIFIKPLITTLLVYIIGVMSSLIIYMAIYYIIIFNKYFDGIDGNMIKNSLLIKKISRNVIFIVILIAIITALNTTNISLNKMLTIKTNSDSVENIDIIGASYTDTRIQRWAYLIFAFVIVIATIRAVHSFKKHNTSKMVKNLVAIPGYLVAMFLVMIVFNLIFVNSNTLDKEKEYLEYNIRYTKNAYGINVEEESLESTGAIVQEEVVENASIINNINLVNSDTVLKTLQNNKTGTGYYSYRDANIAKYKISGEDKLVYIATREILNSGRTYNNKTYEYTHGKGQIVVDSSSVLDTGAIKYLQKEVSGDDDVIRNKETRNLFWTRN